MKFIQAIVFLCLTLLMPFVIAQPNTPGQPVGKVIFSTGDVYADQIKLQSGSSIYVGQTLSTTAEGHLHIRMIDGAFLSLRPSSSAKVALYTVDLEAPANTQIRIDMQYGVVRSVTGKGGEANHSAFRLNTPVAAIGIRGTDFIVYTDAISSVVDLRQGGIEMTPFSDTCSPYTLGVCGGGESVTLLDRVPGLVAEVHAAHQKAVRINKANATVVPDKMEPAHPAEDNSLKQAKETPIVISSTPATVTPAVDVKTTTVDSSKTQTADGKKESSSTAVMGTTASTGSTNADSTKVSNTIATSGGTAVNEGGANTASTITTKTSLGAVTLVSAGASNPSNNVASVSAGATVDVASISPVTAEVGPKESVTSELASRVISQATADGSVKAVEKEVTVASASVAIPPIVAPVAAKTQPYYWGRWTRYAENADQNIVPDPARNKQVFAANTVMLLASNESVTPNLPKSGVVSFKQDKVEAHVLNGGTLYDASVSNPALAVNFSDNHFTTSLDVSSKQLANGTEHLQAAGTLDANTGALRSNLTSSNMTVSGDVADAASHAAYLFNQDSTGIVGAVSWQAQ